MTVNAEVTTPYATALRARLGHDALVVTCAGGMIGYLCTREQMADGGYEPDESWAWIRRSGRFTPALEHTLLDALERAVRAVRGD